jgi:hypothetical protein
LPPRDRAIAVSADTSGRARARDSTTAGFRQSESGEPTLSLSLSLSSFLFLASFSKARRAAREIESNQIENRRDETEPTTAMTEPSVSSVGDQVRG